MDQPFRVDADDAAVAGFGELLVPLEEGRIASLQIGRLRRRRERRTLSRNRRSGLDELTDGQSSRVDRLDLIQGGLGALGPTPVVLGAFDILAGPK